MTHFCTVCHRPTNEIDGVCLRHPETKRFLVEQRHQLRGLQVRLAQRARELAALAQEIITQHIDGVDVPPDDQVERDEQIIRLALRLAYRIVGER